MSSFLNYFSDLYIARYVCSLALPLNCDSSNNVGTIVEERSETFNNCLVNYSMIFHELL